MKRTRFTPLHDRLYVKERPAAEKIGMIHVPESAKDQKPNIGDVIATGAGRILEDGRMIPLTVKAGDVVMYGRYAGSEIKIEHEAYKILREDEVVGIVTEYDDEEEDLDL